MKLNLDKEAVNFGPIGFSIMSAPADKALYVKQFMPQKSITKMEHTLIGPQMTSGCSQKM
jgi:hypothetical protein